MKVNYKTDIVEKVCEFFILSYFIFGLFTTYSWVCTELDKISQNEEIFGFLLAIEITYGFLCLINIGAIIYCINQNHKYVEGTTLINPESNFLFGVIILPLFLCTILYQGWLIIKQCYYIGKSGILGILLSLLEILFYSSVMSLTVNLSHSRIDVRNPLHYKMNNLVLLSSLIGVINYTIFHFTAQQLNIFLKIASNSSVFISMFPSANQTLLHDEIYFNKVQNYVQPLLILFCFCCISYLITLLHSNKEEQKEIENKNQPEEIKMNKCMQDPTSFEISVPAKEKFKSLPPIGLLFGFIFLTIIIIMFVIVISLTSGTDVQLKVLGELFLSTFPIPICAVTVPLLCLQIHSMKHWPKLADKRNIIDQTLLKIGAGGLLIVALAEIKCHTYINNYQNSIPIIFLFVFLIFNCIFQTITISLALDRDWKVSNINSLQSYIRPSFALFCINFAFLLIAVYSCRNQNAISSYNMKVEKQFFLKLFNSGFYTIGVTLVLIMRLHSAIIFGKMTLRST